jgi:hypothetical protein
MAELTRRYIVMPMAAEAPFDMTDPEAVFVLKPWKDPAALQAVEAYGRSCYPELALDLEVWVRTIKAGPVVRGGVGERNATYIASRPARVGAAPARPAKPPAKARGKPRPRKRKPRPARKKSR